MIFGNIRQEAAYGFLPEDLKEFFVYAASHELAGYEKGSHPIDGERFFVNIVEYETTLPENRFWEAHRKYLDVHLMLDGQEQIDLNFIENMEQKEFVEKDDFLPLEGEALSLIHILTFLYTSFSEARPTISSVPMPARSSLTGARSVRPW